MITKDFIGNNEENMKKPLLGHKKKVIRVTDSDKKTKGVNIWEK